MEWSYRYLHFRLKKAGWLPTTRVARTATLLLGLDLLLVAIRGVMALFRVSYGKYLGGWISFLTFAVCVLLLVLAYRWLKAKLLWRLRNRLIVTYMFIGVIPVMLLMAMAFITIYLFAGQFANFVVTSDLNSRLRSLDAANTAFAHELATRLERGEALTAESLQGLNRRDSTWAARQVIAWRNGKPLPLGNNEKEAAAFALPSSTDPRFSAITRDGGLLYLRAVTTVATGPQKLTVISSEPLNRDLMEQVAKDLGEITLYTSSFEAKPNQGENAAANQESADKSGAGNPGTGLKPIFVAGVLPPADGFFDRAITFGTPVDVMDWAGPRQNAAGVLVRVETRPSVLYARLFALADFARGIEIVLAFVAAVFAVIELLALLIGTRLTRTVTRSVAQLYVATQHINRADFSHRIPVKSRDQLATLAESFNSMAASLEKLLAEQKEKQRLENELIIAQEVQAQLFPREISQLPTLEVHGFCRPARTVSGDYYDFVTVDSSRMIVAVGDVSGKGISAALLMATIHSAVRAYSLEGIPILREPVAAGGGNGGSLLLASPGLRGVEVSPSALLTLLNHQLFATTPPEKYATMFLGFYDGQDRRLTYTNGGHLPPIILNVDGSLRRLDQGGTVVGLFSDVEYEEASVQLHGGEIFLAYSDGITEPENDFGEFGEQRLIDLVQENRDLPLAQISDIVTAAVDDWIGAGEQPDDVTLVLARAR
ncbi:MAG TPA: SpoIIE family protein phosphatase [Terriglobales bacterium]|nr:SpoIIE family protein phosphatase [Terriglobales bacterium]